MANTTIGEARIALMKVTKKLKKILCTGLAGCLILGCLAGCADEIETSGSGPAPVKTVEPPTPVEKEKPSAPTETVEPAVPPNLVFSGPEDKKCTGYVIPDGMTEIAEGAFSGCYALTSIEIPNSVTVIEFLE